MVRFLSLIFVMSLFFSACTLREGERYLLSNPSDTASTHPHTISVGVETLDLPLYLQKREVPYLKDGVRIRYISDALWGEELTQSLTRRVVAFLQRSLSTPDVYRYPWDSPQKPYVRLHVTLHSFIAQKDEVLIEASWYLRFSNRTLTFRAVIKEPLKGNDAQSIVQGMDRAFAKLEHRIAQTLKGIK